MICDKCGKTLPDDSTFCQFCGSEIEITTTDVASDQTPSISKEEIIALFLSEMGMRGQKAVYANMKDQPQNETDSQFGLVPEMPIYTAGIDEQERYLNSLRTPSGRPIKWMRRGSMSVNGIHGMVDIYVIYLTSGEEYKTIYMNMYGAKNSTVAPCGLQLIGTAPQTKAVKQKVKKPKKPVNKKLVVCLTVILITLVLISLLVIFLIIPGSKYNKAMKLLEKGEYDLAYSKFEELDGFYNSEEMLLECRYLQALKYRELGYFEFANKIFKNLGDYKDSRTLIHEHSYYIVSTVTATCTTPGSETITCFGCGDTHTNTYAKVSHNYALISSVEATCFASGSKSYKCSNCGATYNETVKQLTHNYDVISTQEPTCQKDGYIKHKCSLCSHEYSETKGRVSHDTVLSSTKDSTCTAVGAKNYKCKYCSYTYSEEIAKKSHSYSAATCTKPKTCSMCGKTEGQKLEHSNTLVCTRCGKTTFEKVVISGVGDKYYTNFDIPAGTYNITINKTSNYNLYVRINDSTITNTSNTMYVKQVLIKKGTNYTTGEHYGYENAVLSIDTSQYVDEQWTVTIEPVGN